MPSVTLVVAGGTTATAAIDGISAAGADPDLRVHTPSADLEIVASGRLASDSPVPVSPTGCPTPAVVTRAVREPVGPEALPVEFLDAGLGTPAAAATRDVGAAPGGDVRERIAAVTNRVLAERSEGEGTAGGPVAANGGDGE